MDHDHDTETFSFKHLKEKWKKHDEPSHLTAPALQKRLSPSSSLGIQADASARRANPEVPSRSPERRTVDKTEKPLLSGPVAPPTVKRGAVTPSLHAGQQQLQEQQEQKGGVITVGSDLSSRTSVAAVSAQEPLESRDEVEMSNRVSLLAQQYNNATLDPSTDQTTRPVLTPLAAPKPHSVVTKIVTQPSTTSPSPSDQPESNPFNDTALHDPFDDGFTCASPISLIPHMSESLSQDADAKPKRNPPPPPPADAAPRSAKRPDPQKSSRSYLQCHSAPALPPRPVLAKSAPDSTQELPRLPARRSTSVSEGRPPPLPARPHNEVDAKMTLGTTSAHQVFSNTTEANRRPPMPIEEGKHRLLHKGPVKSFAAGGGLVCTGVHLVRVFDAQTGENVRTVSHTGQQELKVTAMAFGPVMDEAEEGKFLWCGMHDGQLWVVDVRKGVIVDRKSGAHASPVIFVLRYRNLGVWTIDESGVTQMWTIDEALGRPSFDRVKRIRITSKQAHALIVGNDLWATDGRQIDVFSITGGKLPKPVVMPDDMGSITAMTMTTDERLVYISHDRGNVSVWDAENQSRKASVNISPYSITAMCGAGRNLWIGFHTGMIYVYDPTSEPWQILKIWKAHQSSVQGIVVDRVGLATRGSLAVTSLGSQGEVRVWDGTMAEDWGESQMRMRQSDYCTYRDLRVLLCSWNIDACKPADLDSSDDADFLDEWLTTMENPDIVSVGIQEIVDLESKSQSAKSFFSPKKKSSSQEADQFLQRHYKLWQDRLARAMNNAFHEQYDLVRTEHLVGLFSLIFIRQSESYRLREKCSAVVKTGLGGLHGNKGGIAIRFFVDDSSICFVNCHLAAGQKHLRERNSDASTILDNALLDSLPHHDIFMHGGDGSSVIDHEICFFSGDLNYRIELARDKVIRSINNKDWEGLLSQDQLTKERKRSPLFRLRAFKEAPIAFAPTYKYDPGKNSYDSSEKKRCPAWCDRILYCGKDIENLSYRRFECKISDHRPISGAFVVKVKTIDDEKRARVKIDVYNRWSKTLERKIRGASVWYLMGWGFDEEAATEALEKNGWTVGNAVKMLRKMG